MPTTPVYGLPYPLASAAADIPADMQALALAVEAALGGAAPATAIPPGGIVEYAGLAAPTGFLLCDGSTVSRTTYAALFAAIGVAWNTGGEAGTVFRLPDMRGRIPVGIGSHADVNNLGNNDGATIANRRPKHTHTVTDPGHSHGEQSKTGATGNGPFAQGNVTPAVTAGLNTLSGVTGVTVGPAGAPTDAPSYVVVSFIIKY